MYVMVYYFFYSARLIYLSTRPQPNPQDISVNQAEARCLQDSVSRMRIDADRLNNLINKNDNQAEELAKANILIKKEVTQELRELEHTSVELEAKVIIIS